MPPRTPSRDRKTIYDPVHGTNVLAGVALELVGHPAVQRLWGIRQTGFAHLVFPGANHTRLEHSLGVYWVARRYAEAIGLDPDRTEEVALGGLLHDLGHGPFSHTLDGAMREVLGQGHESLSRAWIEGDGPPGSCWAADASIPIPDLLRSSGADPARVADLVDPSPRAPADPAAGALHGAIDADRIDYLQRDAYYTGVAHGAIDAHRLLECVRSFRGRLVFVEKGRSAVEGFLVGRALMYSSVYYHKTVRAAEVMAQAAVERLPGYPESAAPILLGTDAEFLVTLDRAKGRCQELVRGLLERRLFKRVHGRREVGPAERTRWRRLVRAPEKRRRLEDRLSDRLGAPEASVLIDLAGLAPRDAAGTDWDGVALLDEDRLEFPFRAPSLWQSLALRPPSPWPVAVYVDPRYRSRAERRLPSLLEDEVGYGARDRNV
ncbi:MAG: HD domain-containing protein [Thermoplasmata archaeon]